MKNILVLTDFSIRAGYAADFATHMATKIGANILLCHAIEPISYAAGGIEANLHIADHKILNEEIIGNLHQAANRLLDIISQSNEINEPTINYVIDSGPLPEVVEKIINEQPIDLVVMGSHKANGLARFLFGSHTHTVLDKVSCPLLLVPEGLKFKTIDTIVYATDLSFSNTKVIEYLLEIARPFNSTISVNHFSPLGFPVSDYEKFIESSFGPQLSADHPPVYYNNIKGDDVKTGLLALTGSGKVDIVTLVHKRYDFFEHLFHSSISKQVADAARVLLLLMPHSYSIDTTGLTPHYLNYFRYDCPSPARE